LKERSAEKKHKRKKPGKRHIKDLDEVGKESGSIRTVWVTFCRGNIKNAKFYDPSTILGDEELGENYCLLYKEGYFEPDYDRVSDWLNIDHLVTQKILQIDKKYKSKKFKEVQNCMFHHEAYGVLERSYQMLGLIIVNKGSQTLTGEFTLKGILEYLKTDVKKDNSHYKGVPTDKRQKFEVSKNLQLIRINNFPGYENRWWSVKVKVEISNSMGRKLATDQLSIKMNRYQ